MTVIEQILSDKTEMGSKSTVDLQMTCQENELEKDVFIGSAKKKLSDVLKFKIQTQIIIQYSDLDNFFPYWILKRSLLKA